MLLHLENDSRIICRFSLANVHPLLSMEIGFMIFKLRPGLLFMLSGFFILGSASFCIAQDGETEMTKADSVQMANRHLSFGDRYLKSAQYEDAETQLLKSWAYNPTRGTTARRLGKLYYKIETYDEAINWYRKSIELQPKSKYTKGAYSDLATIHIIEEQPEEAIGCYEAMLEFNLVPEEKVKYFHSLVSLSVEVEDFEKALDYAKLWSELAPDDPEVLDMVATLHMRTGGEDEALAEMEKVMEMSPDDYATLEKLAGMYTNRGDYDKAFDAYEKLYKNETNNIFFLEKTVELGKSLGKPKSWIVGRFGKLYSLQPDNLAIIEQC